MFHLSKRLLESKISFHYQELRPFSWQALLDWELAFASQHSKEPLVFVDAWDFIFQGTRDGLEEVVTAQPLLFHSEKACWPHPEKAARYPKTNSPWKYVNGTGPAGSGEAIADALTDGFKRFPLDGPEDNDQRFWTDVYLSGAGKLDTEVRLSLSLVQLDITEVCFETERVRNAYHNVYPQFIHANGAAKQHYKSLMDCYA